MVEIEQLDDCRVVQVRCVEPGVALRWALTTAAEGTFVDAAFGAEMDSIGKRVFGAVAGKRFLRRWLDESVAALQAATERR